MQAVSGIAYSDAGVTPLASATVTVDTNGATFGNATTGANGYYYVFGTAGGIPNGQTLVAYASAATGATSAASTYTAATPVQSGINIYGDTLTTITSATTLSGSPASTAAFNTAVGSDPAGLAVLANATGRGIIATGPSFTIDQSLSATGALIVTTSNSGAPLYVDAPVMAGSSVLLASGGDLTIAAGASVTGASLVLSAAGAFINNEGADALVATSGNWLVYSANPAGDTFGPGNSRTYLDSNNTPIWDATYASLLPANVPTGANFTSSPISRR